MQTKNKILIAGLVVVASIGTLFLIKNKNLKNTFNDEETGGNIEFDYANASGNAIVDILNRSKKKKIIPVKKYQNFLKSASLSEMKKYFAGKNIYTLVNNVNIREEPYVNNGFRNNIVGTVKNKGVYLGKVSYVLKSSNDNKIWLGITKSDSNKFISKVFNFLNKVSSHYNDPGLYDKNDKETIAHIPMGISINWVRADVVVVDLSDERILKDKYANYYFNGKEING